MRASWMRLIVIRSTRSQTPVRVTGSASITNPGFTPVPRIATLARFAAVSMDAARRRWLYQGYASSSVLDTIGFFARRIVSICGATPFSVELVHRRTTSGPVALSAARRSGSTLTRSFRSRPTISPRSRPALARSTSTAPTILSPRRAATCRTMPAPIGPSPTCKTRTGMTILRDENRPCGCSMRTGGLPNRRLAGR